MINILYRQIKRVHTDSYSVKNVSEMFQVGKWEFELSLKPASCVDSFDSTRGYEHSVSEQSG